MRALAPALLAVVMAGSAAAETKEARPDANFTQMPIEQEGTAHGTPRDAGQKPAGDGGFVVPQGTGTAGSPAGTAQPCAPGSSGCPAGN